MGTQYTQVATIYDEAALKSFFYNRTWDRITDRASTKKIVGVAGKLASSYTLTVKEPRSGNTTPLRTAFSSETMVTNPVAITLALYGGYETVEGEAHLDGAYNVLQEAVESQVEAGVETMNDLCKALAISTIPAAGNYTHVCNSAGAGGAVDVHTAGYVHLGDGATSLATRNLIAAGDVLTAAIVREEKTQLENDKVKPWIVTDMGEKLYGCMLSPKLFKILKDEVGDNSFISTNKHIKEARVIEMGLTEGVVWEGLLFMMAPDAVYTGAGASSIDVYPMLTFGEGFIGKAYTPAESLPVADKSAEVLNSVEGISIRVSSASAAHKLDTEVARATNVGYAVRDPRCARRRELAAA